MLRSETSCQGPWRGTCTSWCRLARRTCPRSLCMTSPTGKRLERGPPTRGSRPLEHPLPKRCAHFFAPWWNPLVVGRPVVEPERERTPPGLTVSTGVGAITRTTRHVIVQSRWVTPRGRPEFRGWAHEPGSAGEAAGRRIVAVLRGTGMCRRRRCIEVFSPECAVRGGSRVAYPQVSCMHPSRHEA